MFDLSIESGLFRNDVQCFFDFKVVKLLTLHSNLEKHFRVWRLQGKVDWKKLQKKFTAFFELWKAFLANKFASDRLQSQTLNFHMHNAQNQLFLAKGQEKTEPRPTVTSSHVKFSANYKVLKKPTNQIRLAIFVQNRIRVCYPLRRLFTPEV